MAFRITYSVLNADLSELHREFDGAIAAVKKEISKGAVYPSWVGGKPIESGTFVEDRNPSDRSGILAKFHKLPLSELNRTVDVAKCAQWAWGRTPWQERAKILRKAADLISENRMRFSVIMSMEAGKNRLESLGDVEESADLIRYYATQLEEAQGFVKPLGKLSPNEDTRSVLRPYGVFGVISPFNFPLALSTGMAAGALLGGNAVILKPSQETPWCGELLYEVLRDAGLPEGVFQLVHGTGSELGAALVSHPKLDGVVFTGSKEIGMQIYHQFSKDFAKPCFLEMGGKNPAILCESADLDKAIEGCVRSAFGLTGQKCSALSRVFVHKSLEKKFLDAFVARASKIKIGDPLLEDTFVGPIINASAQKRHEKAIEAARRDGKILWQADMGKVLKEFPQGTFVTPTLATVPVGHPLWREELFSPFLLMESFSEFDQALARANDADYGLTAGVFSEKKDEVEKFMDQMEAGVLYANRKTGATTGAWPGVQAFCGWKGSGSTGKGGCGPYYVSQFMKEQSQTRML